jgi:hypothetical protein
VTNKVLSGGVATLTTSINHNVTVGQFISVTGVDSTFNGVARVTAKGANTISYEVLANNVSTAAATGSITVYEVNDIECAKSELPTLSSLTVGASGGITL